MSLVVITLDWGVYTPRLPLRGAQEGSSHWLFHTCRLYIEIIAMNLE